MNIPKTKDIKSPQVAFNTFKDIEEKLGAIKELGKDGTLAFPVTDKKIEDLWFKKIKPINLELDPIIDEIIKLHEEINIWQEEGKKFKEREDALNALKNKLDLRRSKFITRISPMIIREYQDKITKYQQFGKIAEFENENGQPELYVTVHDWLASYLSSYDKKDEEHNKKVVSKVHQKMANTADAMEEVE